ncbi:pitrilysin [Orbaceae bacterium ac157xtp]
MKKNYFVYALFLIYSLLACQSVYAFKVAPPYTILTEKVNKSERDNRQYQIIRLSNKMKVLLISDDKAVKSLASLALPVGSLNDPQTQQGLAHYTEHMVLMGSEKYPVASGFSEYLTQHAGSHNASTAPNRTAFYFEVEHSAFDGALDRLADAIAVPLLKPDYADKERNAVNAELTMARSNDGFRIQQVESETINQAHPSSKFFGGNLETLKDKENSQLQTELEQFHAKYYSANLMVGVIYSNQSLEDLATLAYKTFGRINNHDAKVENITQNALNEENLAKWIYMQPAQPKKLLLLQFPIENNLSDFAEKSDEYIGYMLSNRSANTLFDSLQKQGLIESLSASADPIHYGNSGLFTIYVNLTDKGLEDKDHVIASVFSYIELLKQQGINQSYYDEIQKVLAMDFNYPDITRDMSYVEWLSDQMLFYPTAHILDSDNIATHFNAEKIANRLDSLTLKNARIWVIAPTVKTDKKAYFVDAPYRIEPIDNNQQQRLLEQAEKLSFALPTLNPYLVNDLSIIPQNSFTQVLPKFSEQGNQIHLTSRYFANEPKATLVLSLRNNQLFKTVDNQVMFSLIDYIANRQLAELRFQASVAGLDIQSGSDSGLMLTASGFNQHISKIINETLTIYRELTIDEQQLNLAKSRYLESLDAADHANSYSLALQPVYALSKVPYFERDLKRQTVKSLTVAQLQQFKDQLLYNAVPYMISMGNISQEQAETLYTNIKQTLNKDAVYSPIEPISVNQPLNALITQQAKSSDNALYMGYVPQFGDEIKDRVSSYLLYKIISPWFFDQLRTNEQLGYAVFSLPTYIGKSSGIAFLIQSNQYDPAYLSERYQAFYPEILEKLKQLKDDEFARYQMATLNEMQQPPQTLDEEFGEYLTDYYYSRFDFSTKQKKIEAIKKLTKQDIITFYEQTVINKQGLVFASQVIGNNPEKENRPMEGMEEFSGAGELQGSFEGGNN